MKIIIAGYPKSGNTWVTRLVAELVCCPVEGFWGEPENMEIAIEGKDRVSEHACYKSHHQYSELSDVIETEEARVIYVIRDPRDITISAISHFCHVDRNNNAEDDAFLQTPEFTRMQGMVINGDGKVHHWCRISWRDHVTAYLNNQVFWLRYEDLLDQPIHQCKRILDYLEIERGDYHIRFSIKNQSFAEKKKSFEVSGDEYNSRFLRSGMKEQWKCLDRQECFTDFNSILKEPISSIGYQMAEDSMITESIEPLVRVEGDSAQRQPLVIVEMMGGLGNQMFQFAHGLSVARRYGLGLKLDISLLKMRHPSSTITERYFGLQEFGLQEIIISSDSLVETGVSFDSAENHRNLALLADGLSPANDTVLRGYYQGEKFFKNVVEELRQVFTFKPLISKPAQKVHQIIEDHGNTVAVHVRRGDFVDHGVHSICDSDYYLRAKLLIENIVENPLFLVFSEDIEYCKTFLGDDAVYVDTSITDVESLHLMVNCKHNIISNSTFSWWGAWLSSSSKGKVVAPSRFLNDEQADHHYLVENRLYPTDWHLIKV